MVFSNPENVVNRIGDWPDRVAVIGGGRWARVLAEQLVTVVPPSVQVFCISPHNSVGMQEWVQARSMGGRIVVRAEWPAFPHPSSAAVIVANAARDHGTAIDRAIDLGVSALIEKPVTCAATATERVIRLAQERHVYLAAAHVFLFARYVENFAKQVTTKGEIVHIGICWMDESGENRYGEVKRYDASLSIIADCLPHVLSLVELLVAGDSAECKGVRIRSGGAEVSLELQIGGVACSVQLGRNSVQRRRTIEVKSLAESRVLDFSTEPGMIRRGGSVTNGDPDWLVARRPVASMLYAFLRGVNSVQKDARLDIGRGLRANRLIDQVSKAYQDVLVNWVRERLARGAVLDRDLRYSLTEILQENGALPAAELERHIAAVIKDYSGEAASRFCGSAPQPSGDVLSICSRVN